MEEDDVSLVSGEMVMSCESRHRDIVANLLTLAGLQREFDVDTIMRVGIGNRHYTRGRLKHDRATPHYIDPDVKTALGLESHADQTTPAWIPPMMSILQAAASKGNREAFLTLQLMMGGVHAITQRVSPRVDAPWLLTAKRIGLPIPQEWCAHVSIPHSIATIGWNLRWSFRTLGHTISLIETLNALLEIDDVPHEAVQAVTRMQALQFLLGKPFSPVTDPKPILRAILEDAPVVREAVTYLTVIPQALISPVRYALVGCAAHASGRALAQVGIDTILQGVATRIAHAGGPALNYADLRDPSSTVVTDILHYVQRMTGTPQTTPDLFTLFHIWQDHGQHGVVNDVIRILEQSFRTHDYTRPYSTEPAAIPALITGMVRPPHGDSIFAHFTRTIYGDSAWGVLVAAAVYAAMCQEIGHVPTVTVIGFEDRLRTLWKSSREDSSSRHFPLLTVGREWEILLPILTDVHDTSRWIGMILDCIDSMEMLAMAGGDPRALQEVIVHALTARNKTINPQIVFRLAASHYGQAILRHLPVSPSPMIRIRNMIRNDFRIIEHLISPWWETAPSSLRRWWKWTVKHITGRHAYLFRSLFPIYPVMPPEIARYLPNVFTVKYAIQHHRWPDIPEEKRHSCIRAAFDNGSREDVWVNGLDIMASANTTTAFRDVLEALSTMPYLSNEQERAIRRLIDSM